MFLLALRGSSKFIKSGRKTLYVVIAMTAVKNSHYVGPRDILHSRLLGKNLCTFFLHKRGWIMRYDFISALTTLINEKNWQLLDSFVILHIYLNPDKHAYSELHCFQNWYPSQNINLVCEKRTVNLCMDHLIFEVF